MPKQSVEITAETFALAQAILGDSQATSLPCQSVGEVLQQAIAQYWDWYLDHAAHDPDQLLKVVWDLHKFNEQARPEPAGPKEPVRYYEPPTRAADCDRGDDR